MQVREREYEGEREMRGAPPRAIRVVRQEPQRLPGSEGAEATTSVLSPSVISREWASCMTNTAG